MSMRFGGPAPGVETTGLAASLMEKWTRLEPLTVAGHSGVSPPSLDLTEDELKLVSVWADLFKEEIEGVRRIRNFVTHLGPTGVPVSELVDANEFADKLLQLLIARVPRLSSVLGVELPSTPWWDVPRAEGTGA